MQVNPTLVDSVLSVQPFDIVENNGKNFNDQVSLKDSESGPIEYVFYNNNYNRNVPKMPVYVQLK